MNKRSQAILRLLPPALIGLAAFAMIVGATYWAPPTGEGGFDEFAAGGGDPAGTAWLGLNGDPIPTPEARAALESTPDTPRPTPTAPSYVTLRAGALNQLDRAGGPARPPASLPEPTGGPAPDSPSLPAQPTATAVPPTAIPPTAVPPATEPPAPPPPSCPTAAMNGYAAAMFDAINNARAENGMGALAASGCVTYVAQLRSQDMAANSYFAHTSPTGETAFTLLRSHGVAYAWAGENLARNNYPESEAVGVAIRDLMNSSGHRDNMLNSHYTHMGVGYVVDSEGIRYFTMIFIGP